MLPSTVKLYRDYDFIFLQELEEEFHFFPHALVPVFYTTTGLTDRYLLADVLRGALSQKE